MATKKNYDGEFVSSQGHEVNHVCKNFSDDNGDYLPSYTYHLLLHHMSLGGKRKVKRVKFYSVLRGMGFLKG